MLNNSATKSAINKINTILHHSTFRAIIVNYTRKTQALLAAKFATKQIPLCWCYVTPQARLIRSIHPCHTAAILSRQTKRAFFYHAKPGNGNQGMRLSVVKQSFFGPPGQYGCLMTRANSVLFPCLL